MNISPNEPPRIVQRIQNGRNVQIEKPHVSKLYVKNMGGVDQADQLRSSYTVGRQSRKWYRYIFLYSWSAVAKVVQVHLLV